MKRNYLTGFYHLQDGINLSYHGTTSVGATELLSTSKLTNIQPIDNVPSAPPPEDTPDEETIDPLKPNLTSTFDPTKTRAHRQVVGVDNAGGKEYGKATGLYNKNRKYSERWNPWHPF